LTPTKKPLEKLKNSDIESNDISQLYEKPPRICNIGLLDPNVLKGARQQLKPNLIEHFDFEALIPEVWKHFYS